MKAGNVKVDLHTHSIASPDGALTEADYRNMLQSGGQGKGLDYIAITDHNTVDFALQLKQKFAAEDDSHKLQDRVIVGEEIRTSRGEIIGLYLTKTIPKLMTPEETVHEIRKQGGLVCIPHPFENVRRGMAPADLEMICSEVDMIEVHNGRAVFQNKSQLAYDWAGQHNVAGVASSDSHARPGWGRTYTVLSAAPTKKTLVSLMCDARYVVGFPGIKAVLYPKYNKFKTRLKLADRTKRPNHYA